MRASRGFSLAAEQTLKRQQEEKRSSALRQVLVHIKLHMTEKSPRFCASTSINF